MDPKPKIDKYLVWICGLCTILLYLPVCSFDFVSFDDLSYYSNYKPIHEITWENIKHIFSSFYKGNYHPLTTLTWMLEYQAWGNTPEPLHALNALFHAINTMLVFILIQKLSVDKWVAFFTALVFGLHPMHVESVAWISERKDVLYVFFFLLASIRYVSFRLEKGFLPGKQYLWISLLFLGALLSKSAAVVTPVIFILYDIWVDKKFNVKQVLNKTPWIGLSVLFGVMAILSQDASGAIQEIGGSYTLSDRPLLGGYGLMTYVWKFFVPLKLTVFYPYPAKPDGALPLYFWGYLIGSLALISLLIYGFFKRKALFFGIGFFLVGIFLVLQFLPVGGAIMADRYTYLPYIGLAFALFYLLREWKGMKILGLAFCFGLFILAHQRIQAWENSETLWSSAIENYPNELAYNNRAFYYNENGNYKKALQDIEKALEYNTNYVKAYNNRGKAYFHLGKYQQALQDYNTSIELYPQDRESYLSRANVYSSLKNYEKALADYSHYLAKHHDNPKAWFYRGTAYRQLGQLDSAITDYSQAIQLDPNYFDAVFWRGVSYFDLKQHQKAIQDFDLCLRAKPQDPVCFYNRSLAYYGLRNLKQALSDAEKAAALGYQVHPDYFKLLHKGINNP